MQFIPPVNNNNNNNQHALLHYQNNHAYIPLNQPQYNSSQPLFPAHPQNMRQLIPSNNSIANQAYAVPQNFVNTPNSNQAQLTNQNHMPIQSYYNQVPNQGNMSQIPVHPYANLHSQYPNQFYNK